MGLVAITACDIPVQSCFNIQENQIINHGESWN